ncbi:glycosyltransferase family 2 protein [Flavimobilis soli]|uniref:glycosyltransferase family 2 protein n=1 Tax=Flavimobilis soli TaxID=442709 RepID=UPI001472B81E|nr:glycosyltransferase family 2 protein [Flavimobilis soli]
MPFYNVESFLAEAVGSLRAQTYDNLEVLLVDDGSTDGSLALARSLTADDPRFTVLEVPHGGQGAARNHALARSQGEYVTFMDADDVVPSDAYAAMVGSLEASGSDMALGNVERFDSERAWVPGWARAVHRADVRGTTLADMPEAMRDILACNRVYRRSFWDKRVQAFPEGMVFEDHVPMLRALLGGSRFDVLAQVTYRWRRREDRGSSSQPKDELANLADRARAKAEAWKVLEAEGTEEEQGLWLARVLDLDLSPYLAHGGTASDEYRDLLATTAARYLELAEGSESFRLRWSGRVRAHRRLALWYAAHRDWPALASLTDDLERRRPPLLTRSDGSAARGLVVADPGRIVLAPPLPDWLATMLPTEPSTFVVTRLAWDEGALLVRGTLRVPGVSVGPESVSLTLSSGSDALVRVAAPALAVARRRVDAPRTGSELDVLVRVPREQLARALRDQVEVHVGAHADLAAGVTVDVRIVPGTGTRAPRPTPDLVGPVSITPVVSEAGGFVLRQARALVIVDDVTVLDGRLRLAFTATDEVTRPRFGSSVALLPGDGAWTVAMPTVAALAADAPLEVTVGEQDLRPLARAAVGRRLPRGVARASRGTLHAIPGPRLLLTEVRTTDSMIELELAEAGLADVPAGSRWVAVRREPGGEVGLEITASSPHVVRFDVPHSEEEDGDVAPSVTSVRLQLVEPGGPPVSLRVHDRVLDAQPFLAPTHAYDVRVLVRADALELRIEHLMLRRARDATTGR